MKLQRLILLFCLPVAVFFSCTVEHRVHLPGYHVEWKKRTPAGHTEMRSAESDVAETQPVVVQQEPVVTDTLPVLSEETALRPVSVLPETHAAATDKPVRQTVSRVKEQLPQVVKLHKNETRAPSSKQVKAKAFGQLLLAPIRILFTVLLIALVIVGVVLLFVLESSLGGTVLLAAGVVLLVLIIL